MILITCNTVLELEYALSILLSEEGGDNQSGESGEMVQKTKPPSVVQEPDDNSGKEDKQCPPT